MAMKNISLRIDQELLDKLHFIANYEERSANGQILVLIRQFIAQFEEEHGPVLPAQPQRHQ